MMSKNQTATYDFLSTSTELSDLRDIAKKCGLGESDLKKPDAKRLSTSSAALAIAMKVNPFTVYAVMDELGYDLSEDLILDQFEKREPTQGDFSAAGAEESDVDSGDVEGKGADDADGETAGDGEGENEVEAQADAEDAPEQAAGGADDHDDLSRYFGKGQVTALEKILAEKASKTDSAPSKTFKLIEPQGGTREVEGTPPQAFEEVLHLAQARKNIFLTGPTGCGKTHMAGLIAAALDLKFYSVSCSEGMSESQLTGWLLPVTDGGKFTYVPATFVIAYENGGVFLLDEVDAADANVMLVLNTALANGHMHVPQRHGNERVEKHKDFVLIAAANTFGQGADMRYVGRNQLDDATLDRFKVGTVRMDYDAGVEEQLIDKAVLSWGRKLRKAIESGRLTRALSTRFMIDLSDMKQAANWPQAKWEEKLFAGWSRDEIARVS